jgi:peptidoglycan/xylan/chitin deacetylase (PgdA/CDA1 family)
LTVAAILRIFKKSSQPVRILTIICTGILAGFVSSAACGALASREIPGGLPPERTPQFVSIGFDDNYYAEGMTWILGYLQDLKNPPGKDRAATYDGTPVRVTFFNNTDNAEHVVPGTALADTYIAAYQAGHEIGDHTRTHTTSANTPYRIWKSEIAGCRTELAGLSIPAGSITGFRSPYLLYNDDTFTVIKELGFAYDCSIETGLDAQSDGSNFRWPYRLDGGSPDNPRVKGHPGLWELPVYVLIVPPELRMGIKKRVPKFDAETGKVRGLDWNLLASPREGGYGFTRDEYLQTLKYSLNLRLKGNRAPMLFGAHTPFYTAKAMGNDIHPPNITYREMREVLEEFIAYALTKPEVRIVPFRKIRQWCEHPEPLSPTDTERIGPMP